MSDITTLRGKECVLFISGGITLARYCPANQRLIWGHTPHTPDPSRFPTEAEALEHVRQHAGCVNSPEALRSPPRSSDAPAAASTLQRLPGAS